MANSMIIRGAACAVGLAVLAIAGAASAETYRYVSGGQNSIMVADVDTIRRAGPLANFASVSFSRNARDVNGQVSWASSSTNEVNCHSNEWRSLDIIHLAEGGQVLMTENVPSDWRPIRPGSAGWAIRQMACEREFHPDQIVLGTTFAQVEQRVRPVLGR